MSPTAVRPNSDDRKAVADTPQRSGQTANGRPRRITPIQGASRVCRYSFTSQKGILPYEFIILEERN